MKFLAVFTSSDRILAKRETPDGAADDEGIASAIAKETDAPDGRLYAGRKLTEEVNTAKFLRKKITLILIKHDMHDIEFMRMCDPS